MEWFILHLLVFHAADPNGVRDRGPRGGDSLLLARHARAVLRYYNAFRGMEHPIHDEDLAAFPVDGGDAAA
jgi:hypothetical protein